VGTNNLIQHGDMFHLGNFSFSFSFSKFIYFVVIFFF
jgi:hypothetical protein